MKSVLVFLLTLTLGGCTVDENFETKTAGVGDDVTLTCPRDTSLYSAQLFWLRLVSGDLPEFLGGTNTIDSTLVEQTPGFTAKKDPGTFVVIINGAKLSDTGLYFCVRRDSLKMTVLKVTFLQIKGPESGITAVVQDIAPDPVHPGDPMSLQCSVLSQSKNNTCPGKHRVFWFRVGSDETHPTVIYTDGNRPGGCEESPEAHSPQKCVYSFSKTVNSSDAGTYFCAVAACGEILFGKGTTIDIKEAEYQTTFIALILVSAALAINLIFIAFLIYIIKTKSCDSCKAAEVVQTHPAAADRQHQQIAEASLVYSAPTFSKRTEKREKRKVKAATEETIYTGVRTAN